MGVIFNGVVQDYFGNKVAVWVNLVELGLAYFTLIRYTTKEEFSLPFACILNFVFGIQDAGVNNFICVMCAF